MKGKIERKKSIKNHPKIELSQLELTCLTCDSSNEIRITPLKANKNNNYEVKLKISN